MAAGQRHLVVFGCGYVGGAVVRLALGHGWRVTALTRNTATAEELRRAGAAVVVGDLASDAWHGAIPDGADLILDSVSSGGGGLEAYRRSYVDGMQSIVRWAGKCAGAEALVYTSSTSVYPQDGGVVVTEEMPAEPPSDRGRLLRETERIAWAGASTGGEPTGRGRGYRRAVLLRCAGIYGPGRQYLAEQVRTGVVAGAPAHRLNLIHRDDLCRAIWAAFEAPLEVGDEVFNVADDGPAPKAEVVRWLAHRLDVAEPRFSGAPLGSRERITPDRIISNRKLKQVLGWSPSFPTYREGYENILSRTTD